jgi:hypothetical protein
MFAAIALPLLAAALQAGPPETGITRADIAAIPAKELRESLFVVRGKALLVNLEKAATPADWLQVPGVKGAWKKSGMLRGMCVLEDADRRGKLELYGATVPDAEGQAFLVRQEADGTVRWRAPMEALGPDNNGIHCEDLDNDGRREVVTVGNYLQIFDAATGRRTLKKMIFADFHGGKADELKGDELRFDYPYRLARCTSKKTWNIVVAGGYDPDLDGDGFDEIIHSANGGLVVLNRDGSERWRKDNLGEHSDWIPIADVNGDGRLEIVVQQGGAKGFIYIFDALTGEERSRTPDSLMSQVQNLAAGRYRPELPGRQIALTTINSGVLRLLDGRNGKLLDWPVGAAEDPTLLRWNGLDMYNGIAHDADGDGKDEIFTYSTPKGGQLLRVNKQEVTPDASKALDIGVAAFSGDGTHRQYWNFYTPTESGINWGIPQWDMRQFKSPPRRFDIDGNGIEEAYIETEPWIVLVEIADLSKFRKGTPAP